MQENLPCVRPSNRAGANVNEGKVMRRLSVGRIQLTVLDDGSFPFPAHFFFSNVAEATWRTQLNAEVDEEGKIPVGHNCGLLESGDDLIVIDTGYGEDTHDGRVGHLLEELSRAGHHPDQIRTVVFTHGHGDHVKGSTIQRTGKRSAAFPQARYLLARADYQWFGERKQTPEFAEHIATLDRLGQLMLFDGALKLNPEVSLLPTPGHSPGHTSVLIESEGKTCLFLGDLCHHPLHFAHPEWVSAFDTHPALTPLTRAWLFQLAADRDALLICPHARAPGLGKLQRRGSGYAWQALGASP